MKFRVAAALVTGALCAAVVSCSSGPAATARSPATAGASAGTQAPPVTVLTKGGDNGDGDIFLATQGGGQYGSGPEIVSIAGKVLWFHVASRRFDELIQTAELHVEPVTGDQARIARDAYRDFGKGSGHRADLNFGDCFAYALAKSTGEDLLFKGNDFGHTDITSALDVKPS